MKSSTRLEYAVFQLTPTRTRFDLVIVANGKSEKIVSGLINPFLAHLKSVREQFAKGGYSIVLKPEPGTDPECWFTKNTVERFVHFVNTPVVLERVHILESEILQIEKAITIQSHKDAESSKVEYVHSKSAEFVQGSIEDVKGIRQIPNVNEEKAIVLYEPSSLTVDEATTYLFEENAKVQLAKVLETRKTFLQKEQKMAFARALASGFDVDHMSPLISFAECFKASRLMDACTRFVNIWKTKNDIGQWLENEGANAASNQLDYATMPSGKEMNLAGPFPESAIESGSDNNLSHQSPPGSQNHVHEQFSQPVYPPWGVMSPTGLPVFQGYPIQGMPYYPSYPGNGPFVYPPYQSPDGVECGSNEKGNQKRYSCETNGIRKSDNQEMVEDERTSHYNSDLEKEAPDSRGLHRRTRPSKKNGGTVVIRNINYITTKRQSDSESQSPSKTDDDSDKDIEATSVTRSTTRQSRYSEPIDLGSSITGQLGEKASAGNWHAFQNCLMRSTEESDSADHALFSTENGAKTKPPLSGKEKDPLADGTRYQSNQTTSVNINPSGGTRRLQKTSHDELLRTNIGNHDDQGIYKNLPVDILGGERYGSVIRYRTGDANLMVRQQQVQANYTMSSADMCSVNISTDGIRNVTDDSFILPSRPASLHEVGTAKRDGIDMNYDLPSSHPNTENTRIRSQEIYEPEDLGWIAERGIQQNLTEYNSVVDFEMEVNTNKRAVEISNKNTVSNKKDMNQKPKLASGTLDSKKSMGPVKRAKPSKMSPIEEARARAEKLRSFKADLQKQKKEKEEEQKKRIEALKIERQKRITAKSNVAPAKAAQPSPQMRKQVLAKASPGSLKGSKFSDSEPGFSSPLQGVSRRTLSLGAIDSRKASKPKTNGATPLSANKVNKSVSSLSELKTVEGMVTPEPKASMSRIRRLSEPRKGVSHISPATRLSGISVINANTLPGSQRKKVSAIMNLDKTKVTALPDLKMCLPKSDGHTGDMHLEESAVKQMINMGNQPYSVQSPGDAKGENKQEATQQNEGDATSCVELEKYSAVDEHKAKEVTRNVRDATSAIENNIATPEYENQMVVDEHKVKEPKVSMEYNHHGARESKVTTNGMGEPRASKLKVQFDTQEVIPQKHLSKSTIGETAKAYQAPYARISSFEEPCTGNSEYGKAMPTSSNKEISLNVAPTEASASQSKFESVPQVLEKPWVKEPSKGGFKRLLKFGKRSMSSSGDLNSEMDSASRASKEGELSTASVTSSNHAPTLKTLISHDESESVVTPPPKTSRHFSLLSPFRKSSEKKIIIL